MAKASKHKLSEFQAEAMLQHQQIMQGMTRQVNDLREQANNLVQEINGASLKTLTALAREFSAEAVGPETHIEVQDDHPYLVIVPPKAEEPAPPAKPNRAATRPKSGKSPKSPPASA